MTWGMFKKIVEEAGVKDEHEVDWIDWSPGVGDEQVAVRCNIADK